MKTLKILSLISMLLILIAWKAKHDIRDKDYIHKITPPNCVLIGENLYIDQTEISNFHWLEYLHWNSRIFGKKSPEYKAALPDTTVWSKFDRGLIRMDTAGLRHPSYRVVPVVGITKAQAEAFARWRTDRVVEYMLISTRLIDKHLKQDASNFFTIERYLKGNFRGQTPTARLTHIPVYSIPDARTWDMALAYAKKMDEDYFGLCAGKDCTALKSVSPIYSREEVFVGDTAKHPLIRSVAQGRTAPQNGIYNMLGNVAEIVSENGVSMGGSWAQTREEILTQREYNFSEPNAWTGVRFACEWESVADYLQSIEEKSR